MRGAVARDLRTAAQIPRSQLLARARHLALRRLHRLSPRRAVRCEAARELRAAATLPRLPEGLLAPEGPAAVRARAADFAAGRFRYLHQEADYRGGPRWHDPERSPLWIYQLQYLGSVLDLVLAGQIPSARALLRSWEEACGRAWDPVAWHPYPVSMRIQNLCYAAGAAGGFEALAPGGASLVARQLVFLLEHLEDDVRGNHLLENTCALLVASRHLEGPLLERVAATGESLLRVELPEQILGDGGHFERAPMYHCLVLQRLLQLAELLGAEQPVVSELVLPAVRRMAHWLQAVRCPDGEIPLLGDSARGFAPPASALLALAARALAEELPAPPAEGLCSLPDTGIDLFRGPGLYALFDSGPVCPDYLPAHGQADALSLEVWLDGACIVADPGLHDYTGAERAWGRSSRAHSTVTVDDRDSSEVYSSFRIGGRERMESVQREKEGVRAVLRPWGSGARIERRVSFGDASRRSLRIEDRVTAPAGSRVCARLHLHEEVEVAELGPEAVRLRSPAGCVRVRAAHPLRSEAGRRSPELGRIEKSTLLVQELPPGAPRRGWFRIEAEGA